MELRVKDVYAGIGCTKCGVGVSFDEGRTWHLHLYECDLFDGYEAREDLGEAESNRLHHELMGISAHNKERKSWWDLAVGLDQWTSGEYPFIMKYFGRRPKFKWPQHVTGCNDSLEAGYVLFYDPNQLVYAGHVANEEIGEWEGKQIDLNIFDWIDTGDRPESLPEGVQGWLAPAIDQ